MQHLIDPSIVIQPVLDKAAPGDVIELHPGRYTTPVVLRTSGTAEQPITLRALPGVEWVTPAKPNVLTDGQGHWRLGGWLSTGSQSAVEVDGNSVELLIARLRVTFGNRFAIRVKSGSLLLIREIFATRCKNAIHLVAGHHITVEDSEFYNSLDIWEGSNPNYLNGDGLIAELAVEHLTLRRIITAHHADGGLDIKASHVLMQDVIAHGCKNNFKAWGQDMRMENCLSYGAKRERRPNGSTVEGHGLTMEKGATLTAERCTFVDNQHYDLRQYEDSSLTLKDCVIARQMPDGDLYDSIGGKAFVSTGCTWFDPESLAPDEMGTTDQFRDPQFTNRLDYLTTSGRGFAEITPPIDAQGDSPMPTPTPTPTPTPSPTPVPPAGVTVTLLLKGTSTASLKYANATGKWKLELPTKSLPGKPKKVTVTVVAA